MTSSSTTEAGHEFRQSLNAVDVLVCVQCGQPREAAIHRADTPAEPTTGCADCKRPYGDEHGFPDLLIPDWAWNQIAPKENGGGLLCPSCICRRLHNANIECEGSWRSGPLFDLNKEELRNLVGSLGEAVAGRTKPFSEVRRELRHSAPASDPATTEAKHHLITPTTCDCDKLSDHPCPVCDGGLAVCSVCGKAEVDLDGPCVPASAAMGAEGLDDDRCPKCGHDFVAFDPDTYDCRVQPYADIGDPVICGCDHEFHTAPPATGEVEGLTALLEDVTYDNVMKYLDRNEVDDFTVSAVIIRVRKMIRARITHEQ